MIIDLDITVKGGLPVIARCYYAPADKMVGEPAEFIVEELYFRSGHLFPMVTLSDKQIEEMNEIAWEEWTTGCLEF